MAQQPIVLQLVLVYRGQQLKQNIRLPYPSETSTFTFGRNHAFGGKFPYQQVGVVSGSHFVIRVNSHRQVSITDTSSNGTFLNGTPLRRGKGHHLKDGDRITLIAANTKVGLIDVKFAAVPTVLAQDELDLVRRYVSLIGAGANSLLARQERRKIDKALQDLTQYPLGEPGKKTEEDSSLSSESFGAADGHNATLHFKAPIHIVMAKKHKKNTARHEGKGTANAWCWQGTHCVS